MPLPHFPGTYTPDYIPDPIYSNHFDIIIFTAFGVEIENLLISSVSIDEIKDSTTIKCCINSSCEKIADYDTLSTIKYIYFRIRNKRKQSMKEIIYNTSLMGVQCKFDYSLHNSIQESDCTFNVIKSHNLTDCCKEPVDDIIRKIIRSEKIDNILD